MPPSLGSPKGDNSIASKSSDELVHKPPHNHHHRRRHSRSTPASQQPASKNSFEQVRSADEHCDLELLDVWVTSIPAKFAATVVSHLKQALPTDPHSLVHLRRVVKPSDLGDSPKDGASNKLSLLICSCDALSEDLLRKCLEPLRSLGSDPANPLEFELSIKQAAQYPAPTKEQSQEWSNRTWPIMWRGNPNLVQTKLPEDEQELLNIQITKLVSLANQAHIEGELPIATIIFNPETRALVASAIDNRISSGNILAHSIMTCVANVATDELRRREMQATSSGSPSSEEPAQQSYLCHNLHVITTHEPCAMCSMALVHSRIARLVYIKPMSGTGGIDRHSGAGYGIHWNKQLNWRFEAWRWIGDDDVLEYDIIEEVNA
ncbi:cytidine deaminase-like protein [Limtongia smithiae]|uniref:cytidine deaminase-like protein n=1 Tax=Limtongia smithiae TaxID=1125753 RepID=UPI0034CD7C66